MTLGSLETGPDDKVATTSKTRNQSPLGQRM